MGVSVFLSKEAARWWSAVASCASRDSSRVVLTGVYVEAGQLWSPILGYYDGVSLTATDSYRLLSVAIPAEGLGLADYSARGAARDDRSRFLDWSSMTSTKFGDLSESGGSGRVLVPARAFKVARSSGLRLEWVPTDDSSDIASRVQVRATVGDTSTLCDPIAGDFPNWQNLIPVGDIGRLDPFAVNGAYLGGMLSDMAKVTGSDSPARIVSAVDGRKPVRVDCVGDGFAACGIVMPVRVGDGSDGFDVLGHLPAADGGETAAAVGS